ncbi:ABC transporter permease DevC [Steroidobacter sp.]|uniref:ABC transporter permease DevC n=1 Tax=Steroidobacter sp. TaxID=1978227 RepID=UPI001A48130C|nr:ABC transporter permease DevC [Steroidobacter sp.]MBL8266138.1 FtsX-like permease family protein [Steroidobacter sp.]
MNPGVPIAFLQLTKQPRRLLIAVAGIAVSTLGILGQMGFEDSLFRSATRLFQEFDADVALISPQYQFMVLPAQFSERRLYQSLSVPGVKSFSSVRLGIAPFKNPVTRVNRNVYVVGVSRNGNVFANEGWQRKAEALREPDEIVFDSRSRPEFGPIAELFGRGEVQTEIANQRVRIVDLFAMGASFSADGTAIVTAEGFDRLFPARRPGLVDIGLLKISPGENVDEVLARLRSVLPPDVLAMTHAELNEREQKYWRSTTPAGFIFKTVLILSLLVGCVSAYQILYSDISENLRQYATLKAIGYPDSFFHRLTFEKAWLLSSLAYPVGFALAAGVYLGATHLTLVPLVMTVERVIGVYIVILGSCALAGVLAIRRLRRSDLSELF